MENRILNNSNQRIIGADLQFALNLILQSMGYHQIDEDLAKSFGSKDYKNVASKILTLAVYVVLLVKITSTFE